MTDYGFANPALLWGLLAAAIPILIHLFQRRRARRLLFPAIDFVLRSRQRTARKVRLKQILLLVTRTALVAAIALAIARPFRIPRAGAAPTTATIAATALVVDGSLSMRWMDGRRSLFQRAQEDAREVLAGLPLESPATVLLCAGGAETAPPPGFDRAALRERIDRATPTLEPSDLSSCINEAARALAESPMAQKRIYAFGDLTQASLRLDVPPPVVQTPQGEVRPEVVLVDAGRGAELYNVAITAVAVTPAPALGARGYEVAATVQNFGSAARAGVPVALRVGEQIVSRGFVDVGARASVRKVLAHRFEPGLALGAVELEPDALDEDDARRFALVVPRDVRSLVVDGAPAAIRSRSESYFVDAALSPERTAGRILPRLIDAEQLTREAIADADVVLLLNIRPPRKEVAEALASFVERGGGLLVALGENAEPDATNAAFGALLPRALHLAKTAADPSTLRSLRERIAQGERIGADGAARFGAIAWDHPALAVFDAGGREGFVGVRTYRYLLLAPDGQHTQVLAAYDDGAPALIEGRRGLGKVILYTSTVDRDWSDWPIRTSFLPTMQQLVGYLGGSLEVPAARPAIVGQTHEVSAGQGEAMSRVSGPGEGARPLEATPSADGRALSVRPALPGHYRVQVTQAGSGARAAPELTFAADVDVSESDLRRADPGELRAHFGGAESTQIASEGPVSRSPERGRPAWSALLWLAVGAFFAEGLLTRR